MPRRILLVSLALCLVVLMAILSGCAKPPQSAVHAAESLRRMASATEVGMTYLEYSARIIDLKGDVDEALAELPSGELKGELRAAMQAYTDALDAWSYLIEHSQLFIGREPGASLKAKYHIPETETPDSSYGLHEPYLDRKTTFNVIWGTAAKHVDRVSKLVGR